MRPCYARPTCLREGFGNITEIDVMQTLQAKIGTMFLGYVVVQGSNRTEIAAIDPAASM